MKRGVVSRVRLPGGRKIRSENIHYMYQEKVKVIGHLVNAFGGLAVGSKQTAVD